MMQKTGMDGNTTQNGRRDSRHKTTQCVNALTQYRPTPGAISPSPRSFFAWFVTDVFSPVVRSVRSVCVMCVCVCVCVAVSLPV